MKTLRNKQGQNFEVSIKTYNEVMKTLKNKNLWCDSIEEHPNNEYFDIILRSGKNIRFIK